METFKSLLQEFDATLRQYNMPGYEKLLPPLPDAEIDKNLKELGIDDENLRMLYQWKNGVKDENQPLMTDRGGLISVETIKESVDANDHYDPLLIPFISDIEEMLLFNNKPGPHYGKIYLFSVSQLFIDYPVSYYDSLAAMIKTTIAAYKEKALKYDSEDDWLDEDVDKFYEIAKRYNTNCVYWTEFDPLREEEWYEI